MTTLLTAILYLWLALTILLAVMWFLREQDRRHKDRHQNRLEDELLTGSTAAEPEVEADTADPEVDVAEPQVETGEPQPEAAETEVEAEAVETEPLPWSKNNNKRKKKSSQAKRSKAKPKAKPATEEPPVEEPAEAENEPVVAKTPGILDLLNGVTLPYDLTPLTTRIEDPDRHAIFISPHADAAEVGTAFADELVQQGFEIEAAGFDEALASRDEDSFTMRISPEAGKVADGSSLRYPSARETDVAIEVWIGNGSPPALSD